MTVPPTPPFIRIGPERPVSPVILSVPHAGRDYGPHLLKAARLGQAALETLEDRLVDRLIWRATANGATAFIARAPRAEIDLNRDAREIDPAMVAPPLASGGVLQSARTRGGLGLIPSRIAGAGPTRSVPAGATFDVAAVGAASWDVFVRTGEVPPGELAPLWTSPPYSHCNFTAMPSLNEALSNALLEAMAAGAPVVATRVGGTPEALADGETGLLVPPADVPALAAAITQLLQTPVLGARLGRAARQVIEDRFSIARMAMSTQLLYRELLTRQARRAERHMFSQGRVARDES